MKNRLTLMVVLFFVLGSTLISGLGSLSYNFKSSFYITAMAVLIIIGISSLFKYIRGANS